MSNNPYSLEGKVALVTGAARGIGRAVGDAFVKAGADHVQYADILEEQLEEIEISDRRSTARLDVTSEENWQSVILSFIKTYGRIDVLINNAGVLIFNLLVDTTEEEFSKMLDVNVKGVFLTVHRWATKPVIFTPSSSRCATFSSKRTSIHRRHLLVPADRVAQLHALVWRIPSEKGS